MNHTNEISPEQYAVWHDRYKALLSSMRFTPPLDRERSMLYLLESMLLRVRLAVGLGDPGAIPHAPKDEGPDPDGVREAD